MSELYQDNAGLMGPPVSLDGPPPLAPPYGLVPTVAEIPVVGDDHWINGAWVWGYPPGLTKSVPGCSQGSLRPEKDDADAAINPKFAAITAYLPFTCSTLASRSYDELKARLLVAFDSRDSYAIERELAFGTSQPDNPWLGDENVVIPNGNTPVSVWEGLAILEDYLGGETGNIGTIHGTPGTLTALTNTVVNPVGGKLRTLYGNYFVAGAGYVGSEPEAYAGSDLTDQQSWMYATGLMQLRRSEPFIPQDEERWAIDMIARDNSLTLYAERYALVTWDAVAHAAVLVDRSIPLGGN